MFRQTRNWKQWRAPHSAQRCRANGRHVYCQQRSVTPQRPIRTRSNARRRVRTSHPLHIENHIQVAATLWAHVHWLSQSRERPALAACVINISHCLLSINTNRRHTTTSGPNILRNIKTLPDATKTAHSTLATITRQATRLVQRRAHQYILQTKLKPTSEYRPPPASLLPEMRAQRSRRTAAQQPE